MEWILHGMSADNEFHFRDEIEEKLINGFVY